ncbi:hypothetical protein ACFXGA_21135 [Actinosynnema sp. NPDC059335]|uniref:hypothetical protein n=1 Tax=Actinosynnema sp. NPDC059335 TaxID=3346804 RepID=UPI00366CB288
MIVVNGEERAVASLLALLGDAAGLALDGGDPVTATRADGEPRSPRLRAALEEMAAEPRRTARVAVSGQRNVHFGIFGSSQRLNVVNLLGVEEDVPGLGVVIAIHEVWENYRAWRSDGRLGEYGPAHAAALELEAPVGHELIGGAGGRVAAASTGTWRAPAYVLDLQDRFVVLDARPDVEVAAHGLFRASVRDRVPCGTVDIDGAFPVGRRVGQDVVRDAAELLRENPAATARVTALHTDGEPADTSRQRAEAVRNALVVALDEDGYAEGSGILLDEVRAKGVGADLGARRSWVDPGRVRNATPGIRVAVATPASAG